MSVSDDILRISFSNAEQTANHLLQEAETLMSSHGFLARSVDGLLSGGFRGAFSAAFDTNWGRMHQELRLLGEYAEYKGKNLKTAIDMLRRLDAECAALFNRHDNLSLMHLNATLNSAERTSHVPLSQAIMADGQVAGVATTRYMRYDEYGALIGEKRLRKKTLDHLLPRLQAMREDALNDIAHYQDEQSGLTGLWNSVAGVKDDYADIEARAHERLANIDSMIEQYGAERDALPDAIDALIDERDSRWHAGTTLHDGQPQDVYFSVPMNDQPDAASLKGYCLRFVQDWRADMDDHRFGAAADLIHTQDSYIASMRYTLDGQQPLAQQVRPGHLLVYDRNQLAANKDYGHVAAVVEVRDNAVIVKESSWNGATDTWREVPINKLEQLTFIGDPWGTNK